MKTSVPESLSAIRPYSPGKPLAELAREYGVEDAVKLASNENPLGPSPRAVAAVAAAAAELHRYPDGAARDLTRRLARHLGVRPGQIVLGNGSDEIIVLLERAFLRPGDEVILPRPAFLMYEISAHCAGAVPVHAPLRNRTTDLDAMAEQVTPRTRMIFICNPNNPTGTMTARRDFERFLQRIPPEVLVVVDEAYIEFARDPEGLRSTGFDAGDHSVVTLRTFSKAYGLAGLRVGYGVMPASVAEVLHRIRPPFNVNLPAQAGAAAALDDAAFLAKTVRTVHEGIDFLRGELEAAGFRTFPTEANFFLLALDRDAGPVFEALLREGVIVRSMAAYGYPDHLRISVGTPAENRRFLAAFRKVMA